MRLRGIRRSKNVEGRGGRRGSGGRAGGLGLVGVLAVLAIGYFTGIDVSPLIGAGGSQPQQSAPVSQADAQATQFSAQVLATTEDVWGKIFPEQLGREYVPPKLVVFSSVTQSACGGASGASSEVEEHGGIKVIARAMEGINPKDLRGLIDDAKKSIGSGVVAMIAKSEDGKAGIAVGVTKDLMERMSAVDLVRVGAEALGGKGGGGRPDMAQAGGPDASKADAALHAIKETVGALAGTA